MSKKRRNKIKEYKTDFNEPKWAPAAKIMDEAFRKIIQIIEKKLEELKNDAN